MSAKSFRRRAARILRKTLGLEFVAAHKLARRLLSSKYYADYELDNVAPDACRFRSICGDGPSCCGTELVFYGPGGTFTREELVTVVRHLAKTPSKPKKN